MKNIYVFIFIVSAFFPFVTYAQKDSLFFNNTFSIETGGDSYSFYRINEQYKTSAVFFNVNYRHNFKIQKAHWLILSAKSGIGYGNSFLFDTNTKRNITEISIGGDGYFGKSILNPEFGISYCTILGKQQIPVNDMPGGVVFDPKLVYESVNFYDYLVLRFGLAFIPPKKHFPFVSVNWSPVLIPGNNPVPFDSSSFMKGHFLMKWFGATLGYSF